ncbi:hypothetical protein M3Y94_01039900 [Aphelenchoides besseyi]|nr:hypothetical protein M3Y94_01039900 [Aphelenchoides besseyi]
MANNFNFLLTKASKDDIKTAVDYVFDPFIKALREATLPSGFTYEQTFDRFKTYMKRKFELIGLHDWMELCKLLFDSFGRETPKELNQVIDVQGGCATLVPTARQVFVLFFKVFIGDFDGAKVGWFQMLAKFLEASKPFAIDGIKEYLEKCKKEGDKGISSILFDANENGCGDN